MKDYYQIIGVQKEASLIEIKRSFRKLANQYHPDKNPALEAESLFKEINEAYEVLSDPVARTEYDRRLSNPGFYTYQNARPGRPAYAPPRRQGPSDSMIWMLSVLKYAQLLFYFGCAWSFSLVVDYTLPSVITEETVIFDVTKLPQVSFRKGGELLITDNNHHFPVHLSELKHFPPHSKLKIHKSSLFGALIKVENYNNTFEVNNLATIYRNFSFAPILLMLSCLVGVMVRKGIEFHVNLGIVVFLLMILNIVFLYTSRI